MVVKAHTRNSLIFKTHQGQLCATNQMLQDFALPSTDTLPKAKKKFLYAAKLFDELSHQREQLNRYLLLCIRYLLHVNKEVVRLYGTPHLSSRPMMHL